MIEATRMLGALAQETRLKVIKALATAGEHGLAAGEIAGLLQQPSSTLSFHLSALEEAGLLRSKRNGRYVFYAVQRTGVLQLFSLLNDICCASHPSLSAGIERALGGAKKDRAFHPTYNVLFLCTGNSGRSIMAEAILEKVGHGRFNAFSAGSSPARRPLPAVLERLEALGHETSGLRSKSWDEFTRTAAPRFDFVLTLCDTLAGQECPAFRGRVITAAWPFPDPANFKGSDFERTTFLNMLYGALRRRIECFIALPHSSLDQMALKARLDELGDPALAVA
ncbi:MAG TPA: metalloregulator ArsR/SmtB family transcription factor [Hyphomicrobiaceae bacterium]|nr:metalloregulator ArsR/SmtB family transcription factor [Hyphomicrobiaceae bacterium]